MDPSSSPTEAVAEGPGPSASDGASLLLDAAAAPDDPANRPICDTSRIRVHLGEWGPRTSDVAERLRTSVSAVIRIALAEFLKDEHQDDLSDIVIEGSKGVRSVNVNAASARRLTARARASGMTQGMYLDALIAGNAPPPLPADHAELRSALARSNDQLAVTLADLNGFTRLVAAGHVEPPVDGRASLDGLIRDVRMHLGLAAQVLAQLKPPRRTP